MKVLLVTSPSFQNPCHCTVTPLSPFLSCPWILGVWNGENDTGDIHVFGCCSESGAPSALGESFCCIAALHSVGLCACFCAVRLPLQVKGSLWISGRSDCKTGRQTSSLICLPLGRILLPYQPQDIWGWRNIFITDCVCVCDRESERKGELG